MNKRLLMLLVIFGLVWLLLTLTGCTAINESEAFYGDRFEEILDEGAYGIICDTETRVQYVFYEYQQGIGLTLLVDHNGDPLLYKGE